MPEFENSAFDFRGIREERFKQFQVLPGKRGELEEYRTTSWPQKTDNAIEFPCSIGCPFPELHYVGNQPGGFEGEDESLGCFARPARNHGFLWGCVERTVDFDRGEPFRIVS